MENLTLSVGGMSCSHCERAVKNALEDLNGVSNVLVSLEKNSASFDFDKNIISIDEIKKAIEEEGYDV